MRRLTNSFNGQHCLRYVVLLAFVMLNIACSSSDNDPTVLVGQSKIKLIAYPLPEFVRIDDSNDAAYRAAGRVLGGIPEERRLALYTAADTWNHFVGGINDDGPQHMLECVAEIITDEKRVDQTINLAQFKNFTEKMVSFFAGQGDEVIGTNARYLTVLSFLPLAEDGPNLQVIYTYILVEGKVLRLNAYCLDGSRFENQFRSSALAWREAYLEQTKP